MTCSFFCAGLWATCVASVLAPACHRDADSAAVGAVPAPASASVPTQKPVISHILLMLVSGGPDGGLDWMKPGAPMRMPQMQQVAEKGVWIEVASSPDGAWPALLVGDAGVPDGLFPAAEKRGVTTALFGPMPLSGAIPGQPRWWLGDPLPHTALPHDPLSGMPPVQLAEKKPGMAAPVRVDMTRHYLLQMGDGAGYFIRQMALEERMWLACFAPLAAADLPEPDAEALRRASQIVAPVDAPRLASWLVQDDALGRMLSELVTDEQMGRTLVVLKGEAAGSPLVVWWPGHIEGGTHCKTTWNARQVFAALCAQAWADSADVPAAGLGPIPHEILPDGAKP